MDDKLKYQYLTIPNDLKQVTDVRAESVRDQVAEKGIQQLELPGFGAYKNPKIKQQHQGNATSLESLESATKSLDDIEARWGAEGGSAGSVTSAFSNNMFVSFFQSFVFNVGGLNLNCFTHSS